MAPINKSVSSLGIEDLFKLLSIGDTSLSKAAEVLKQEEIDGNTLVSLTDVELNSLGLKMGPKKALKQFIENNKGPVVINIDTKEEPKEIKSDKVEKNQVDGAQKDNSNKKSTTKFDMKPQETKDGWTTIIEPVIQEPFNPNSYGEFNVRVYGKDNKEIAIQIITVTPDTLIQLPETLFVSNKDGSPLSNCQVILVEVKINANGEPEEVLISNNYTQSNGEVEIIKDLPDGSYILRTLPKTAGLKAKEINLVIALGRRNPSLKIETPTQHSAYNQAANLTSLPTEDKNKFGNSQSNDRGLIREGGLNGFTIMILKLYQDGSTYSNLTKSLKWTGLNVEFFDSFDEKAKQLLNNINTCQLWILGDYQKKLSTHEYDLIIKFYESGKGLYLWGDNEPYYQDVNELGKRIIGVTMYGDTPGDKSVKKTLSPNQPGFITHPIFTGLSTLYEGITIATIDISKSSVKSDIKPILWGSANNLVTIVYKDPNHKSRLMMDTGYTRLFDELWDTAGTSRFVINSAGWLANLKNKI